MAYKIIIKENTYPLTTKGYFADTVLYLNTNYYCDNKICKVVNFNCKYTSYKTVTTFFEDFYYIEDFKNILFASIDKLTCEVTNNLDADYTYVQIPKINKTDLKTSYKFNLAPYLIDLNDVQYLTDKKVYDAIYKPFYDATLVLEEYGCKTTEDLVLKLKELYTIKLQSSVVIDTHFLDLVFEVLTNNYIINENLVEFKSKLALQFFINLNYNVINTDNGFIISSRMLLKLLESNFNNFSFLPSLSKVNSKYFLNLLNTLEYRFLNVKNRHILYHLKYYFYLNDILAKTSIDSYNNLIEFDTKDLYIQLTDCFLLPILEISKSEKGNFIEYNLTEI